MFQGINALSIDNNGSPLILMSKKSTVFLSDRELQFLLGHELGHIASENLICHTVKGKGVSFMENEVVWHGKTPNEAEYKAAREELKR